MFLNYQLAKVKFISPNFLFYKINKNRPISLIYRLRVNYYSFLTKYKQLGYEVELFLTIQLI